MQVKKALNFDAFGDKVTGKKVVMVETLRDVDLTHELRTFADEFVFETVPRCLEVSPGGTTRRIVQPVSPQRPRSRKTVAPRTEVSPIGTKRKQPAKPTPKKEGKRKRIMPPTPRMPIQAQSSTRDQSTSSARRSKDAALIETPMKRYRHKEQEKELADAARLKTMSMIGFSMYLSSPAKHATLTPRRATPPKPKVEAPVSTKKVYNRISLLEAEMEDFKRMMDESSLPSTI